MTSVVVGAIVVVEVVVEVEVVEEVVTGPVVLAEILVAPCAEPDEHAAKPSSRAADPAITLAWRNEDIQSKYPLSRAKCWQSRPSRAKHGIQYRKG